VTRATHSDGRAERRTGLTGALCREYSTAPVSRFAAHRPTFKHRTRQQAGVARATRSDCRGEFRTGLTGALRCGVIKSAA